MLVLLEYLHGTNCPWGMEAVTDSLTCIYGLLESNTDKERTDQCTGAPSLPPHLPQPRHPSTLDIPERRQQGWGCGWEWDSSDTSTRHCHTNTRTCHTVCHTEQKHIGGQGQGGDEEPGRVSSS